jgi:hypothetical protein
MHNSLRAPLHKHSAQRLAVKQVQLREREWERGHLE